MHDVMKGMLVVLMLLYVISPIDLCPGPIDDIILFLAVITSNKRKEAIREGEK